MKAGFFPSSSLPLFCGGDKRGGTGCDLSTVC
jgi:hypothetical protein